MHQKTANDKTLCKIWLIPFTTSLPTSMNGLGQNYVAQKIHTR